MPLPILYPCGRCTHDIRVHDMEFRIKRRKPTKKCTLCDCERYALEVDKIHRTNETPDLTRWEGEGGTPS